MVIIIIIIIIIINVITCQVPLYKPALYDRIFPQRNGSIFSYVLPLKNSLFVVVMFTLDTGKITESNIRCRSVLHSMSQMSIST
jgi:ABC-type protease/lipase transport system fused ATPase/permease subunit